MTNDRERERIERCLAVVDAYEASGHRASVWAAANGVALRELASWCGHAGRWRARLHGAADQSTPRAAPAGFVAATLPTGAAPAVGVQWPTPSGPVTLHWPMSHVRELGAWLREAAR